MTFVSYRASKCSAARRHLPAAQVFRFVLIGVALGAAVARAAAAQQTATVERDGLPVFGEIGGNRLGQLSRGARFTAGASRSDHTQLTLEGWIFRASLRAAGQGGHPLAVGRTPSENMRDAPNGRVLAQLVAGFLVDTTERRGQWVKVRRDVWVATSGLRGAPAQTAGRPQPSAAGRLPPASTPQDTADPRRGVVRRRMQLFRAPDSAAIGSLEAGTPVRITARAGGWVRVETQAWVRESEIRASDAGILTGLSAAELRGAPDEFRGRLLRWTIQFLALQTADELRPDFTPGQKYILARGPAPEYAFVYIAVPAERLAEVQRLEPLATVTVVARVVNGRSTYLANPILELVELQ
jgi:hypothetical protein